MQHVIRDAKAKVMRCLHCLGEQTYDGVTAMNDFLDLRRMFTQEHELCRAPKPQAPPPVPPGQKEEIPMAATTEERRQKQREYARASYARKKAREGKSGAPAVRKTRGRPPAQEAAPRPVAAAIAPASPVNGITIHTEHSIVSVTTEGGATVIRVREVGREG